jgi:hypothetical protein
MKKNQSFRLIICATFIIASLFCISCKYVDDNFLSKKETTTDSVKSGYLSESKNINTAENLENADSLTAIFDENGNVVESISDSVTINNSNLENSSTNTVPNSAVKDNNVTVKNIDSKINGTKIAIKNKNAAALNNKTEKAAKLKSGVKKVINTQKSTETDAERDYRLQKSNHSIPDL